MRLVAEFAIESLTSASGDAGRYPAKGAMQVGDVVSGKVKSITDYGLFVSTNGLDFLLLLHELSWRRIGRPDSFASIGDIVEFKIINLADPSGNPRRLGSPRQVHPGLNPWRDPNLYVIGERFVGKIEFTASWGSVVLHPVGAEAVLKDVTSLSVDQQVTAVITAVDTEKQILQAELASG